MKVQNTNDKRLLPEWEEISAVAMSVQNMHLMTTVLDHVGAYWSSFDWCEPALESKEMKQRYFNGLLPDPEDRILGALVLGKYPKDKCFRSTRTSISKKINFV